ncbi:MAG: FMN-binding negative transcriptional regulator [Saprospiraceae bacterium]|nr:FMN-binding negative transcriptional regulator [Saprospiraceae bacterium]
MFIPKLFKVEDSTEILDFIRKHSFGILISVNADGLPIATHIPIELEISSEGTPILRGHVSRANPHAQLFGEGATALAIFSGAHSYISSSWYEQENVSTWNYSAVHVYGRIRLLTEEELYEAVEKLTATYEAGVEKPVLVSQMSQPFVKKEIRGIVGFEMQLDDVQAKAKLSQNRKDADYKQIVEELEKTNDPQAHSVAADMRKKRTL